MSSPKVKGAKLHKKGCRFTVWAPHADEVHVVGTFNDWDKTAHPMTAKKNGIWAADIAGAWSRSHRRR